MSVLPAIGSKASLSKKAYDVLKEAIITNKFKPGQVLVEESIASELAISRTPVRSALKKLEFEGLLTINPSRNIVVNDITKKDIEDLMIVRVSLEPIAAASLSKLISDNKLKQLQSIIDNQKLAYKLSDMTQYLKYDYMFHVYIATYCENKWLLAMIENINVMIRRVLILAGNLNECSEVAIKEHEKILEAIKNKDSENAHYLMKCHVDNVKIRISKG